MCEEARMEEVRMEDVIGGEERVWMGGEVSGVEVRRLG